MKEPRKIISTRPTITRKDLEGVLDCLIHDELTTGSTIRAFEGEVSNITRMQYALATSSLTAAYHLVFRGLNLGDEDEVIIPSYFEAAPLSALTMCRGKAVLIDCDRDSLFPSEDAIKKKMTGNTKAIIIGHTFGFHSDAKKLAGIDIPIIEDISHAFGNSIDDIPAGSLGTFAVLSLAPSMIITTGNGGMVLTNNSRHYSRMKDLRNGSGRISYEYCMTDLQGAMGLSQLQKLKDILERRKKIAKIYYDALKITGHKAPCPFSDEFAYQSFPILFDASIEKVEKYWRKTGIETTNPIRSPLHAILDLSAADYPNSTRLSKKLFSIPIYPTLSREQIETVARALSRFI